MTPVTGPQGWDRTDALLVRQRARRFRRRLFCGSGSFTWTPETTARFSRFDDQSRNQAPPCQVAGLHANARTVSSIPTAGPGHGPRRLAVGVPLGDGLALVVAAPALGQRQLDLGSAVLEVHREGDERQRLLLGATHHL